MDSVIDYLRAVRKPATIQLRYLRRKRTPGTGIRGEMLGGTKPGTKVGGIIGGTRVGGAIILPLMVGTTAAGPAIIRLRIRSLRVVGCWICGVTAVLGVPP